MDTNAHRAANRFLATPPRTQERPVARNEAGRKHWGESASVVALDLTGGVSRVSHRETDRLSTIRAAIRTGTGREPSARVARPWLIHHGCGRGFVFSGRTEDQPMFDDILDIFERDRRHGTKTKQRGGLLGRITSMLNDDDDRDDRRRDDDRYRDQRYRDDRYRADDRYGGDDRYARRHDDDDRFERRRDDDDDDRYARRRYDDDDRDYREPNRRRREFFDFDD
jgi:hypothetical protein